MARSRRDVAPTSPATAGSSSTSSPARETDERWRIGVLATRVGLSETVLRAWEVRYGLLSPVRTPSGYRLYGREDERRVRAMTALRDRGVPAARAAAEVLARERAGSTGPGQGGTGSSRPAPAEDHRPRGGRRARGTAVPGVTVDPGDDAAPEPALDAEAARRDLASAMVAFDVDAMHEVIDRVLRAVSVESAIRDVLLPFMSEVGLGWSAGDVGVADEHFATEVVRARLAALSVGGAARTGPLVLLACPPGEAHDVALKAFEVVLQRSGWRTRFLGTQTPTAALLAAAEVVDPDLVVLAATRRAAFEVEDESLTALRARWPVAVGGAGADAELAAAWGALHLRGDPVSGAQQLVAQRLPVAR